MNLEYVKGNIFEHEFDINEVVFAHCISADGKMGAGIAKQFVEIWGESLRTQVKREADSLKELCEFTSDEIEEEMKPEDLMIGTAVDYQNDDIYVFELE